MTREDDEDDGEEDDDDEKGTTEGRVSPEKMIPGSVKPLDSQT